MRWWSLAALASMLVVVSVIALTGPKRRVEPPAQPSVDACPSLQLPSGAPVPSAGFFSRGAVSAVAVDGHDWAPGVRLTAGRHALEVRTTSGRSLSLTVDFPAFATTLLEVHEDPAAVLPWLVGGTCTSCQPRSEVSLAPASGEYSLDESAGALAQGQWQRALEVLRRVPLSGRAQPRVAVQLASAVSLAGRADLSPLLSAMTRAALDRAEDERGFEQAWLQEWWNRATDRFGRVALAMATDAPRLVEDTRSRVERMSGEFAVAQNARDLATQRKLALRAEEVTQTLARELVALRPSDCAWRERLQRALR